MKRTSLDTHPEKPEQNAPAIATIPKNVRLVINLIGIVLTWSAWFWFAGLSLPDRWYSWLAIAGVLILFPIILIARRYLDMQPTLQRAAWITAIVHYLIAIFLGCAVIAATHFTQNVSAWVSPLPSWLGLFLMALSGLALLGGAIHLLNKGLGLPLGTEVTRVVVTNWLYAWTRNPIALSTLAFLVGTGLWLGSGPFLLWVFALVFPAIFIFLQVFEERELEIRFGSDYLEYKQRTPMFWPRRPKNGTE